MLFPSVLAVFLGLLHTRAKQTEIVENTVQIGLEYAEIGLNQIKAKKAKKTK